MKNKTNSKAASHISWDPRPLDRRESNYLCSFMLSGLWTLQRYNNPLKACSLNLEIIQQCLVVILCGKAGVREVAVLMPPFP